MQYQFDNPDEKAVWKHLGRGKNAGNPEFFVPDQRHKSSFYQL